MKNATNFSLFSKGKMDGSLHLSTQKQIQMNNSSVLYRLGYLYGSNENCPRLMQLIIELYREFSYSNTPLPNLADIRLHDTYSHRLLKTTFKKIGYQIPVRPNRLCFHAWRIRWLNLACTHFSSRGSSFYSPIFLYYCKCKFSFSCHFSIYCCNCFSNSYWSFFLNYFYF